MENLNLLIIVLCLVVFFLILFNKKSNIQSNINTLPTSTITSRPIETVAEQNTNVSTQIPIPVPTTATTITEMKPYEYQDDATTYIENLINNNIKNNKPTNLPSGVYRLTRPLNFKVVAEKIQTFILTGSGEETTILVADHDDVMINVDFYAISSDQSFKKSGCMIRDLTVKKFGKFGTYGTAFKIVDKTEGDFSTAWVRKNIYNVAFGGWNVTNSFDKCIHIIGSTFSTIKDIVAVGNTISPLTGDVIVFENPSNKVHSVDNTIENIKVHNTNSILLCKSTGYEGFTCSKFTAVGCRYGVYMDQYLNANADPNAAFPALLVSSSHFNCIENAIYVNRMREVIITGCVIYHLYNSAGSPAILLKRDGANASGAESIITNNQITGGGYSNRQGISLESFFGNCIINDNIFTGFQSAIKVQKSQGVVIGSTNIYLGCGVPYEKDDFSNPYYQNNIQSGSMVFSRGDISENEYGVYRIYFNQSFTVTPKSVTCSFGSTSGLSENPVIIVSELSNNTYCDISIKGLQRNSLFRVNWIAN